ncbi:MAG: DUF3168 domain-containing protein [Pseudomonadota bacterium]
MSYAMAAALQTAVYDHLIADAGVGDVLGDAIYDALPPGTLPPLYAVLGAEGARDASDKTGAGAWHRFTISIVTQAAGFASAKLAATAICDALIDAPLTLSRGSLISLHFDKARAARIGAGAERQITLMFRARVADAP